MKTKIEIIDETLAFYQSNPRSIDGDSCVYLNRGGLKCAFSRCCTEEGIKLLHPKYEGYGIGNPTILKNVEIESLLMPEYQGHPIQFWVDVQNLHDSRQFWAEQTLLGDGIKYVEELKQKYEKDNNS